jgi:hypothetical protein
MQQQQLMRATRALLQVRSHDGVRIWQRYSSSSSMRATRALLQVRSHAVVSSSSSRSNNSSSLS